MVTQADLILQNWWEFKYWWELVWTTYSAVHSFMVCCTFYIFLFPFRDSKYPSNGGNATFFTKILNKSVHHSWAAKKVLISRTCKTLVLSFWWYINFIKNEAEAVSGQFFMENYGRTCYLYKLERTSLT